MAMTFNELNDDDMDAAAQAHLDEAVAVATVAEFLGSAEAFDAIVAKMGDDVTPDREAAIEVALDTAATLLREAR